MHLIGGESDDVLSFVCQQGPNPGTEVYLQEWGGYDLTAQFIGRITAGPGDDELIGSPRASEDYLDSLNAGNGADKVVSLEGDDYIDAGSHADQVYAGPGDDGVFAGSGEDIACGEDGADNMVGGLNDDTLYGGGQSSDVHDGGPGVDDCGNENRSDCYGYLTACPLECPTW